MKKLGKVQICGIPHEVYEAEPAEDSNLDDCYGYIVYAKCRIVVRENLEPELFRNVLIHEGMHGIFEHSGLKELSPVIENYQETFIQIFTPHWIAFVLSLKKFLKCK